MPKVYKQVKNNLTFKVLFKSIKILLSKRTVILGKKRRLFKEQLDKLKSLWYSKNAENELVSAKLISQNCIKKQFAY